MSYPVCTSCSTNLSIRYIPFEEGMKKICNNKKLSKKEKDKAVFDLLDKLGIPPEQYCCRMILLSYCKLVKVIM